MYKLLIFGIGSGFDVVKKNLNFNKCEILACIDNYKNKTENADTWNVISPLEISKYNYDYIVIASQYYKEIYKQLLEQKINPNKIYMYFLEDSLINDKELKFTQNEIYERLFINKRLQSIFNEYIFDWINDKAFNETYSKALKVTKQDENLLHKARSYVLLQYLKQTLKLSNDYKKINVVECGVYKGLSSYLMLNSIKECGYDNRLRYHIFDSFEGLSKRENKDINNEFLPGKSLSNMLLHNEERILVCPLQQVKDNLKKFKSVNFYKGWVPEKFGEVENLQFSFVHIDLDLYQPIIDSLRFFYPRMIKGGIIILDDYGFLDWPGAKKATEEFMQEVSSNLIRLPTGQAIINIT